MKKSNEWRVVVALGLACLIMVIITILSFWLLMSSLENKESDDPSEIQETAMVVPKAAAPSYEPRHLEKNIFFKVDGGRTADEYVNLRSEPGMSDKYRIGRLASGTEFVANAMYVDGDFYGFPVEALKGIYDAEDEDGVLWMSRYYLHAEVYSYPETQEGIEARDKEWISTELTTLTIVGGNPRVRSTPSTKDMGNVYGTFPEGTVIKTSSPILVDCGSYTFYGIRVADVEGYLEELGYGHIWYDADNIVWVSSRYAEVS